MTFHEILTLFMLALVALVIVDFLKSYATSKNTGWMRLLDAGHGSATILWSQFGLVIAAIVAGFDKVSDFVCQLANAPGADEQIKAAIHSYFTPATVGTAMAVYIAITVAARARTLGK